MAGVARIVSNRRPVIAASQSNPSKAKSVFISRATARAGSLIIFTQIKTRCADNEPGTTNRAKQNW